MPLQVAKVLTVDEIASDKLYKTTIDIGGGQTRQARTNLILSHLLSHCSERDGKKAHH